MEWWTGIILFNALYVSSYTYLTCAHTMLCLMVSCADRCIKLLLLNKVTYCYLLKSTVSAILLILSYIAPAFCNTLITHIAMYSRTSK